MENIRKCKLGEFDSSNYPIIRFTVNSIEPTVEDIKEYVEFKEKVIASYEGQFVMIFDGTNAKWLDSNARVEMGKGAKRIEEKYVERYKKALVVVPNVLVHMLLKGVNLVSKKRVPQTICKTLDEALLLAQKEVGLIYALENEAIA